SRSLIYSECTSFAYYLVSLLLRVSGTIKKLPTDRNNPTDEKTNNQTPVGRCFLAVTGCLDR
ncbi:MAG: hypothetical protein ACT6FF_10180, partial [Methanosarcinaceae archaeon]